MIERASRGVVYFTFPAFDAERGLVHAISSRLGGVSEQPYATLNLSLSVGDDPQRVRTNRRRFADAVGVSDEQVVPSRQVHGISVWQVTDSGEPPCEADVLVTNVPNLFLSQRFADCVPIFLWDPDHHAAAAAHAGWRGTAAGVAGVAVEALQQRYGSQPSRLLAGIGPSIGPCCYEVGPEVAVQFAKQPDCVRAGRDNTVMLDLWELNRRALVASHVPDEWIEVARQCTRCLHATFFSHRADGYPSGRFGTLIGVAR